jgi:diaminopimelate epimerase
MTHRLTKHHGLGNDFLVLLGTGADLGDVGPDEARRWCERHRGVGADGLLLGVTDGPADLAMTLYNADGSRAEMSGNGIRCLAQAEAIRRGVDRIELRITTDGGERTVAIEPGPDTTTIVASVDMGPALPGPDPGRPPAPADGSGFTPEQLAAKPLRTRSLDLGNPHLVLLVEDPSAVVVTAAGPMWEAGYDAGINVHAVALTPGEADALTMAIWERGAGATEACGTGATAAARAAHDWGLVGPTVTVHMPGGDVEVLVGERMTLRGPATRIATVEVER